jgi:hypothetical protein
MLIKYYCQLIKTKKKRESIQDIFMAGTHLLTILFKPAIARGAACDATDCSPLSAAQNTAHINNANHMKKVPFTSYNKY